MNQKEIMDMAEQYVLHTYNRFPLAIDHGEGVKIYDADGREYLDFMAGIAVHALGYQHPAYNEALEAQLRKVLHTSNLYYHEPLALAAKALVTSTGLSKAFFTNSGAEAIEGAIKAAKKYAYTRDGHAGHEIVAMRQSFHGRTVGALSVTGNAHYQDPFLPLMGGVSFSRPFRAREASIPRIRSSSGASGSSATRRIYCSFLTRSSAAWAGRARCGLTNSTASRRTS